MTKRLSSSKLTYSIKEAAQALGVGRTTIYALIDTNQLIAIKVRGRRLITAESMHNLVNPNFPSGLAA